jgi:hypothetical protein
MGAALFQIIEGKEKPVAFLSRTLSPAEKNYTVTELELTAVVWGLKRLRHLVYGVKLKIHTDHHSICWLYKAKRDELSPKLCRMLLVLGDYDIEGVYHISGKKHEVPDCLSRFPVAQYDASIDDLQELPLLITNASRLLQRQNEDSQCQEIVKNLNNGCKRTSKKYAMHNDVLVYRNPRNQQIVPFVPKADRATILMECHDDPFSSHQGFSRTFLKIQARYYWPTIKQDVFKYVQSCHDCQSRKIPKQKPLGLMQFIEIPEQPFERIQIDIMGPFTRSSNGNKYVVTAVDYLTKWMEAKALREISAETVAKFIIEQIVLRSGLPRIIQTDRGTNFTSDLFQEMTKMLGIRHNISTAYHPQSQGVVERSHATLTDCLAMYVGSDQKDWDRMISHCVFAINTSVNETTKYSPFFLIHGREPLLPKEVELGITQHVMLEEILRRMQEARALAGERIHIQQNKNAERLNTHRRDGEFSIGDQVLLRKFVKKKNLSSKLMHYYYGPYVIVQKVSDVNFVIEAKVGKRVHRETVHIDKLKPYYERSEEEEEIQSANKCENKNGREDDDANNCELKNDELISIIPNNEVKLDNISVPDRVNEHQSRYNLRRRKINQIKTIQSRTIFPSKKRGEDEEDQDGDSHHHRDSYHEPYDN